MASMGVNGVLPYAAADSSSMTTTSAGLSADEIALYDRQIRLWGAQAQERIRSAHILLISLRALGTEIAKNLTLAGVSSITIIDDEPVTEEDLEAQYFLRREDVGKPRGQAAAPRIQELNPRVTVKCDGSLQDLLTKDQSYYSLFTCVIACDHDYPILSSINTAARFNLCPFYAAGIHGFYGFIFADLGTHEFIIEREKSNVSPVIGPESVTRSVLGVSSKKESNGKEVEMVKKREIYCPLILANSSSLPYDILSNRRKLKGVSPLLACLRALFDFQSLLGRSAGHTQQDLATFTGLVTNKLRELQLPPETVRGDFLRSFMQNLGAEIVPTAAFVGGRLSEDVINVIGQREQPIQNFALFDGDALEGKIYSLYSPPPEVAQFGYMNTGLLAMPVTGGAMGNPMVMPTGMGSGLSNNSAISVANGTIIQNGNTDQVVNTVSNEEQEQQQPQS